ncbi:hypothetical protein PanWU01x14_310220 [Parasponia andersonii]|uniref:Uncharacterized protein n=1 Tax=Parasponia andersonii TaxID=3476 RepID=A0A2P5AQD1_PARAD|nr:hypothetical protein PanWU01x14_310220 [Parasponia andersonii]
MAILKVSKGSPLATCRSSGWATLCLWWRWPSSWSTGRPSFHYSPHHKATNSGRVAAYTDYLVAASAASKRINLIDLMKLEGYDPSAESNPGMLRSLSFENQKPHVKNVVAQLIRTRGGAD